MPLQNSPPTNKPVFDLPIPGNDGYEPTPGSAFQTAHEQGSGATRDERDQSDVRKHTHNGVNSVNINIKDLSGFIRTVSAVPSWVPTNFYDQLAIYKNGATIRLYIYDVKNKAWRYTALT